MSEHTPQFCFCPKCDKVIPASLTEAWRFSCTNPLEADLRVRTARDIEFPLHSGLKVTLLAGSMGTLIGWLKDGTVCVKWDTLKHWDKGTDYYLSSDYFEIQQLSRSWVPFSEMKAKNDAAALEAKATSSTAPETTKEPTT